MFQGILATESALIIKQKRELGELLGFETRNKYAIETPSGQLVGYAAEQQKGLLGFLFRQLLGHWRRFNFHIFDANRNRIAQALHPFRWIFQRLELYSSEGEFLGALQQRFSILSKRFDLEGPQGETLAEVRSPIWKIWTFEFMSGGVMIAKVQKKWSGLLKEAFLDADNFRVEFGTGLSPEHRLLLVAAGLFIDLQYFEKKAR